MSSVFRELIVLILDKLWLHLRNCNYLLIELLIQIRNEFFLNTNLLLTVLKISVFIRNIFFQSFYFLYQLLIFICNALFKFIIKFVDLLNFRRLILVIKVKWRVLRFMFIKLIFEILQFICQRNNLFNFIFNLLLMVKLYLSKPLINCFIIFLNDTWNHSFAILLFLFKMKFLIILYIFHQSVLNLNRKSIIILVLMRLAALRSKFSFFWILCQLNPLLFNLSFEFLILNNVIHIFLFEFINFLDWVILNHHNVIIA